jgi:hypothetical protein
VGQSCPIYYVVVYYTVPERRPAIAFVETALFTRRVVALGLEEPLRNLQVLLTESPEAGALDPGTGGLRKVRMADPGRGKGKRGSARVHYLWLPGAGVVYMLSVYS